LATTLVDAGPLVAILDDAEPQHRSCLHILRVESAGLLTVWPVLAEALSLLARWPRAQDSLLEMVETGHLGIAPIGLDDIPRMRLLMKKYSDLPMDPADAALVRVAERDHLTRIFTLDRHDFSVYRLGRKGRFEIVP